MGKPKTATRPTTYQSKPNSTPAGKVTTEWKNLAEAAFRRPHKFPLSEKLTWLLNQDSTGQQAERLEQFAGGRESTYREI